VIAVGIDAFEDLRPKLTRIFATVYVERDSQKGIVIGRGAERLKSIGSRARKDIEYFLGSKVFLDLSVKVAEDWTSDPRGLARMGYGGGGASERGGFGSGPADALLGLDDAGDDEPLDDDDE
jgi:GTP-binding protein Era